MSLKPTSSARASVTTTKLIVLSAPSGTGKSTLASMLLARSPSLQLSVSFTTRPPRGEEKNGSHYFFVDAAEFERKIKAGELLEHALVFNKYWYGTDRATVEARLNAGKNVLFDIDVQGARSLKKAYGARCVTIFLLPPSFTELENRLRKRQTESADAIQMRLDTAREELKHASSFDHQIVNVDLEKTCQAVEAVLRSEGCL